MRPLLFLLLASAAFALVLVPPQAIPMPDSEAISADIGIDSEISGDNVESAAYTITLANPNNRTLFVTLPIIFNYLPESVSLKRDGQEVELAKGAEKGRLAGYSDSIGIEAGERVTYELRYTALRTPNEYGIWGLKYSYNPPVSSLDARSGDAYVPISLKYSGEIRFAYRIDNVFCTGCTQSGDKIKIDGSGYIGLSWDKKRTPYRAGIFYLLLLSGLLLSIARARRTPQKKQAKRRSP